MRNALFVVITQRVVVISYDKLLFHELFLASVSSSWDLWFLLLTLLPSMRRSESSVCTELTVLHYNSYCRDMAGCKV